MVAKSWESDSINYMTTGAIDQAISKLDKNDDNYYAGVQKIIEAGVDMFGGESCAELLVDLVNVGKVTESRLDESVRRILHDKFILGIFDDPYLKEENLTVFNNEEFKEKAPSSDHQHCVRCIGNCYYFDRFCDEGWD